MWTERQPATIPKGLLFGVKLLFLTVLVVGLPMSAAACTPVVQLAVIYAGPGVVAIASLGATVLFKSVAFAFLERRLRWFEAIGYLCLGNVVTTVIGILLLIPPTIPVFGLAIFPLVYFLSRIPAARVVQISRWRWASRLQPDHVAWGMVTLVVVSTIL
ncbi:MAG: hypothetical protein EB034_19440, partial [Verrucomicrobia bacterium]|nr:hypothetical protein [Verrucomicrobiota bacterium]